MGGRGLAEPAVDRTKGAAGKDRGGREASPVALATPDRIRRLGPAYGVARNRAGAGERGGDAQTKNILLPGRAKTRRLVEVEDRSAGDRCRAGLCAEGAWP